METGGSPVSLAKAGTGMLTLSSDNLVTGGFALNAGGLTLSSNGALGSGALTAAAGTTIDYVDISIANAVVGRNPPNHPLPM